MKSPDYTQHHVTLCHTGYVLRIMLFIDVCLRCFEGQFKWDLDYTKKSLLNLAQLISTGNSLDCKTEISVGDIRQETM